MDRFFDRLGDLLRSLMDAGSRSHTTYDDRDPDMQAAIEELDEFLKHGGFSEQDMSGRQEFRAAGGDRASGSSRRLDESLRQDYATLEVAFGAPLPEVRKAYKRLLHKYHPDRFTQEAKKQKLATEVTQRLNEAFKRIESFYK